MSAVADEMAGELGKGVEQELRENGCRGVLSDFSPKTEESNSSEENVELLGENRVVASNPAVTMEGPNCYGEHLRTISRGGIKNP